MSLKYGASSLLLLYLVLQSQAVWAIARQTRESLALLEERLASLVDSGELKQSDIDPLILAEARPKYAASDSDLATSILQTLKRAVPSLSMRLCEACMDRRVHSEKNVLEFNDGSVSLEELRKYDDAARGESPVATAALYAEETPTGLTIRLVNLRTGRILLAEIIDANEDVSKRSTHRYSRRKNLERQARGESILHGQWDIGIYPGQHISYNALEQWGSANQHLSGIALSLVTPVAGVGAVYYRVMPTMNNALVGGKIILSVPKAISEAASSAGAKSDGFSRDSLVNFIGIFRLPVPVESGSFGIIAFVSLTGQIGLGVSF